MNEAGPIGVFDSGVGGLSVLKWIRETLPNENLIYVADSQYAPYGEQPQDLIEQRAKVLTQFLIDEGAKAVVVACNTATVSAINLLRDNFSVPIVGIEPGIKPAVSLSKSGVVGVMATTNTVNSDSVLKLINRFADGRQVEIQPCPGLVECVEKLELNSPRTHQLVQQYVTALLEKGVDTIVLGCTHYPFLLPSIQKIAGNSVEVIDTGEAVAREAKRRLEDADLCSGFAVRGVEVFWSSQVHRQTQNTISTLWGSKVLVKSLSI